MTVGVSSPISGTRRETSKQREQPCDAPLELGLVRDSPLIVGAQTKLPNDAAMAKVIVA